MRQNILAVGACERSYSPNGGHEAEKRNTRKGQSGLECGSNSRMSALLVQSFELKSQSL
jgi:hypothetical protein